MTSTTTSTAPTIKFSSITGLPLPEQEAFEYQPGSEFIEHEPYRQEEEYAAAQQDRRRLRFPPSVYATYAAGMARAAQKKSS